ncbi:MAG: hypothetical protein ACP5SH_03010 [Syntrophobacteraceae bacterium]
MVSKERNRKRETVRDATEDSFSHPYRSVPCPKSKIAEFLKNCEINKEEIQGRIRFDLVDMKYALAYLVKRIRETGEAGRDMPAIFHPKRNSGGHPQT